MIIVLGKWKKQMCLYYISNNSMLYATETQTKINLWRYESFQFSFLTRYNILSWK